MTEWPCNIDVEMSVLGLLLLQPQLMDGMRQALESDDFHLQKHKFTWQFACELYDAGTPPDGILVASRLMDLGKLEAAGGLTYLSSLRDHQPIVSSMDGYIAVLKEKTALRRIMVFADNLGKQCKMGTSSAESMRENIALFATNLHESAAKETRPISTRELIDTVGVTELLKPRRQEGLAIPWRRLNGALAGLNPSTMTVLAAYTGRGKCHGRGTPILMFDGTIRPVELVLPGDLLMGPDSRPRKVLGCTSGIGPIYKINPIKGEAFTCNDVHVLSLMRTRTFEDVKPGRICPERAGEIVNIPLNEYLAESLSFRHRHKLWRTGVDFRKSEDGNLPVSPYFLGVLLGDGSMNTSVGVTTADPEIVRVVEEQAAEFGLRVRKREQPGNRSSVYYLSSGKESGAAGRNKLLNAIRSLGLCITCEGKFIPLAYKTASRECRLEILAGLLDTDGSLHYGGYDFCVKSKRLIDDTAFIARSLGLCVVNRKSRVVNGITYYRIGISGDCSIIPMRIRRKGAHRRIQKKQVNRTGFKVVPLGTGEYFGFTLSGDGLYLLGDFTVTHNTSMALQIATHAAKSGKAALYWTMEMAPAALFRRLVNQFTGLNPRSQPTFAERSLEADAIARLYDEPVYFDRHSRTVAGFRSSISQVQAKTRLGLVVVDYLQLIRASGRAESRTREVGENSRSLKLTAMDFELPFLVLSQFSRPDEKKPATIHSLKESGDIENDADAILLLNAPEFGGDEPQQCTVNIGKNREGPAGVDVPLMWRPMSQSFHSIED